MHLFHIFIRAIISLLIHRVRVRAMDREGLKLGWDAKAPMLIRTDGADLCALFLPRSLSCCSVLCSGRSSVLQPSLDCVEKPTLLDVVS